jgi:hypothetical protein
VLLGAMPASSATPIKTVTSPDLADLCRANINVRHRIAALVFGDLVALGGGAWLRFSDEGRHLTHEVFEVSQGFQPIDDYLVVDPDVVVDQDVAKTDRLADGAGELGSADAVLAEQSDGVAVIGGRPPPLGRADVLGNVHTALDSRDERVFDSPEPHGVRTAALVGRRLPFQHGDIIGDAAQQTQNTILIDHGYPFLAVTAAANSRWARVIRGSSSK